MVNEHLFDWDPEFRLERIDGPYTGLIPNDLLPDPIKAVQSSCHDTLLHQDQWQPRYTYLSNPLLPDARTNNPEDPFVALTFVFENDRKINIRRLLSQQGFSNGIMLMEEFKFHVRTFEAAKRTLGSFSLSSTAAELVDACIIQTPFRCQEVGVKFDQVKLAPMDWVIKSGVLVFDIALVDANQQIPKAQQRARTAQVELEQARANLNAWETAAKNKIPLDKGSTTHSR